MKTLPALGRHTDERKLKADTLSLAKEMRVELLDDTQLETWTIGAEIFSSDAANSRELTSSYRKESHQKLTLVFISLSLSLSRSNTQLYTLARQRETKTGKEFE